MEVRTPLELAAAVRGRRNELKLSQEDVAVRAGVSRSFLARFETGRTTGGIDEVLAVLDALGLTLELRASATDAPSNEQTLDELLADYDRG